MLLLFYLIITIIFIKILVIIFWLCNITHILKHEVRYFAYIYHKINFSLQLELNITEGQGKIYKVQLGINYYYYTCVKRKRSWYTQNNYFTPS